MKLTPEQKLAALAHRFYGGATWSPKAGDHYTTSRADLELYQVVDVKGGMVFTRYTEGSDTVSEWPEAGFLTEGFGPKRVHVPVWVLDQHEEQQKCPICDNPLKPDDLCATDIEMGTCHAACLEGSPVVDLDTGDELPDGNIDTYRFSEVMEPPTSSLERRSTHHVHRGPESLPCYCAATVDHPIGQEQAHPQTPAPQPILSASKAAADVLAERRRQIEAECWTLEHDDAHQGSELAWAGACYAIASAPPNPAAAVISQKDIPHALWPWALQWFKPSDRRRDLVKAAALIIAEIERLDRTISEDATHEK